MKRKSLLVCSIAGLVTLLLGTPTLYAQTTSPTLTITPTPLTTTSSTPTITTEPSLTGTVTPSVSPTITPTATETPEPVKQTFVLVQAQVGTQSPWTKKIPAKLQIKPLIDGEKIIINWQKRTGIVADPMNSIISNPKANQVYTLSVNILPQGVGYQRTVAEVILVTDTENYVVSQDIVLTLDANKMVTPKTSAFQTAQLVMYSSIVIVFVGVIPGAIFIGYKYVQKTLIPRWYAKQIDTTQT
jgi:hypothetical protein